MRRAAFQMLVAASRILLCTGRARRAMGGTAAVACLAAVAAAAASLAVLAPAAADSAAPTPLRQSEAGVEPGDVLCNAGRILLISPGGAPACAFAGSLGALADRGWLEAPAESAGQGPAARPDAPGAAAAPRYWEPLEAGQDRIVTSTARPLIHHNTLTISKYPVVGEVAEMTFTVTAVRESDEFIANPPPAKLLVGTIPSQPHRVFDIVSNIGTGDPGVFTPYDYNNVSTLARPGETYTVKAKFEILEEGAMSVRGRGLHDDIVAIYIAASENRSMSLDEYDATGQTYLDHMMARGQEAPPPTHIPDPDIGLAVPDHALNRDTLLGEYNAMLSSFAEGYVELNYTEDRIVDELFYWGYLRSDIREFFVHIMNYTEEQAGAVRMGDDLLAAAYRWGDGDTGEIVDDMLTRRNYTADEVRDFFWDYMYYTDDEDVVLALNATTTRTQAGAAGQQQRVSLFTVTGKVYTEGYFSTATMPIHGIRVCAYDHDASTMRASILRTSASGEACTFTAQSGTYVISGIRNDDPNDATSVDLLVRVLSEGSRLSVAGTSGASYTYDEPVINNFAGSRLDRDITLTGPAEGAGRIIDTISDGRRFFDGYRIDAAPLAVRWQHDDGTSAFAGREHDSASYGISSNTIWLNGNGMLLNDNSDERLTILHEFGHHVMDIAGRFPATWSCPSPHYLHNQSSASCAWTEGWAGFVPHMVDNSARMRWTNTVYVDLEQDRTENSDGGARTSFARTGPSGDEGHIVEGQVAAALWDIKDSLVDAEFDRAGQNTRGRVLDDLSMGDDEIVGTVRTATYASFEDVYTAWESARAPAHSARNIMELHAMGFASGGGTDARPLADGFNGLDRWAGSGNPNWRSGAPLEGGQPPGQLAGNTVARARHCTSECVLTLRDGIDLSGYDAAGLSFWRFFDGYIRSGDYLRVDVSPDGGSTWSTAYTWGLGAGNDDRWHRETLSLAPYLNSTDFKVRLAARLSYVTSDAAIDDVVINGTAIYRAGDTVDVLSSGFEDSLEGWAYRQVPDANGNRIYCGGRNNTAYSLSHSQQHGGSAYVNHVRTCWFGNAGAVRTFDVPASLSGADLNATARFQSFTGLWYPTGGQTNNLHLLISDSAGNVVASGALFQGLLNTVVRDTGLRTATLTMPAFDPGRCPCTAYVHLYDHWLTNWSQRFYLDDLRIEGQVPGTCGIRFAKSGLDVGSMSRDTGISGFDTQTVYNDGSLPISSLSVAYSRITGYDSRGNPTSFTLPPSGAQVRSAAAGLASWTPASSLVQFGAIPVGGSLDIQYRFNLGSATVIPVAVAQLHQTATYNAVCSSAAAAAASGAAAGAEPDARAPSLYSASRALVLPANSTVPPIDRPQLPALPAPLPPPPSLAPPPAAGPGIRDLLAGAPQVHSTLKVHELLGMHASNGTRIIITEKYAYDTDVVVDWDDYPGADRYKVVVHRADSPQNRTADAGVTESRYRMTGLEPSTEYVVRVGVRGDDSTQSAVRAATLPSGSATLPSGLRLEASLRAASDAIDLRWDDTNGVGGLAGDGRYRLEMSIDGGPFEPAGASRAPHAASAEQTIRPEWLGSTLAYRVSERVGPQQLFSGNATVQIPGSLQAPSNLAAGPSADAGGSLLSLTWDHAPLFRHYVAEVQGADGSWERIGRTQGNSLEYEPPQDDGRAEYAFRVYAQLGAAASPPSDTATARIAPPPLPPGGGVTGAAPAP